ncbi:MAG: hypothetical protein K6U88_15800 [Dehalococcoidia bacterium]|nr:hypothetical protein [Dehalococcoidia bacterium]
MKELDRQPPIADGEFLPRGRVGAAKRENAAKAWHAISRMVTPVAMRAARSAKPAAPAHLLAVPWKDRL